MPSMAHDVLVGLFKNRPSLGAELLTEALGVSLPPYTEARLASIDLTEIQPAEYRADIVVLLIDKDDIVRVVIVEVQLGVDPDKRLSWPAYTMVARAQHRCPAGLLVVAPDPNVAAWCAEPIDTGIAGFVLTPPVLGRNAVPIVIDPDEAARRPELAVLSAMAYGDTDMGAAIAAAVLPTVAALDAERSRLYGDLVLNSLNDAARRALEAMMVKGYQYQSDFAKKYFAQGLDEGRKAGLDEGRKAGLDEGRKDEGRKLLLRQLRARFGELPAESLARIEGAEIDQLERWADRVLFAQTMAEVLDDPS